MMTSEMATSVSISVKPFSFFMPGVWRNAVNVTSDNSRFYEALSRECHPLQRVARWLDNASENRVKTKKNRRVSAPVV
ncbi:hypothetical protein ACQRKX_003401 [Enterobacter cloacae]|uniref:hypothetical protein n=1 Tax=Enterobacter TaxID=547 RepID=UPI00163C3050|nr:hypothetical protein [Enterobacter cloacae]MBE1252850.1 hypothetical protein [Enterobacter cloacae]